VFVGVRNDRLFAIEKRASLGKPQKNLSLAGEVAIFFSAGEIQTPSGRSEALVRIGSAPIVFFLPGTTDQNGSSAN